MADFARQRILDAAEGLFARNGFDAKAGPDLEGAAEIVASALADRPGE